MKNLIKKAQAKLNNNQGFTLVELMVVIVIIAILAAVALPAFSGILDDSKDSAATAEARSIYMVAEVAYNRYDLNGAAFPTIATIWDEAGVSGDAAKYSLVIDTAVGSSAKITVQVLSDSGNLITFVDGANEIAYKSAGAVPGMSTSSVPTTTITP